MKTITLLFRDTCEGANRGAEVELDYLHHGRRAEPLNHPRSLGPVSGYGYYSNASTLWVALVTGVFADLGVAEDACWRVLSVQPEHTAKQVLGLPTFAVR